MSGELHIISNTTLHTTPIIWPKNGPPSLDILQKEVGGWIEHVKVRFMGKVRDAYVDEDGVMKQLGHNEHASAMLYGARKGNTIYGDMVVWVPNPKLKKVKS